MSGKLRAQRAKSMKFKDGYMISSGQPVNDYIDSAVRHVLLRQVCQFLLVHVDQSIKSAKSLLFTSRPRASFDFLVLFLLSCI